MTLEGDWGSERHSDWHGLATADEPMVAVVFLTREAEVSWCKSERALGPSAPVRLALFCYDEVGKDVQVNFSVGEGGRRLQTLLPLTGYRPVIERGPYVTGRVQLLARIEGEPPIDCHVLFVTAQQVRVVRSGLWRVKAKVAELLEPPLRGVLTRGRTGTLRGGITTGLSGPAAPAAQPDR